MTREEAIKIIENNRIIYRDWEQEKFDEAIERLKQPITLAELFGWEEGQEYYVQKYDYNQKVENGKLYDKRTSADGSTYWDLSCMVWTDRVVDYYRQATKVEPKPKAWRVRDKYSYECLIKELNESFKYTNTLSEDEYDEYGENTVVVEEDSGLAYCDLDYLEPYKDKYDIVDYYKEEPKYYVPSDWNKAVPVEEVGE